MGTVLYQQSNLQISAEPEGWLYAAWIGLQSEADMRQGSEEILNQARRQGTVAVLNDQTRLQGTWLHMSDWIALEWMPRLRSVGVSWVSWVHTTRFVELAAGIVRSKSPSGMVECFTDTTTAAAWLRDRLEDRRRTQRIVLPPKIV